MISTVVLHSSGTKSTVEEPIMIRNKAVRKLTPEECNTNNFFSVTMDRVLTQTGFTKQNPLKKGITDSHN